MQNLNTDSHDHVFSKSLGSLVEDDPWFCSHCGSAAALQERFDKELQSATTETDGSDGANGVSDVTGRGEEPAAEGANDRLEQVTVAPVLRKFC